MIPIFEGKELFAYHHRGSSGYLLITFSGAGHVDYAGHWFLMKDVVQRNDINCIGITSNTRNFFLTDEMSEIERVTRSIRKSFKTIILLGPSMGAYAAIKYSRTLGATHVLSFSPQYSMDADELELAEDQKVYLRSGMIAHRIVRKDIYRTMAPRPDEVSGRIVIVYDTAEIIDTFAARMFERKLPNVVVQGYRNIGHFALDMYDSDVLFLELMALIKADDTEGVLRFLGSRLRENPKYLMNVLEEAARRKPLMCARALACGNPRIVAHRKDILDSYIENILIINMYKRRNFAQCYATLKRRHLDGLADAPSVDDWSGPDGAPRYDHSLLFSELATFLAFDITKRELVFVPTISHKPYLRPVLVSLSDDAMSFFYEDGNATQLLPVDLQAGTKCVAVPKGDIIAVEVRSEGSEPRNLRACPNGDVQIVQSDVGQHESFTLVAMPKAFARSGLGGGDWFDRTLMRHVASDPIALTMPRRSALARLFRRESPRDRRLLDT